MLCACATTKPSVIVDTKIEREAAPKALIAPCAKPWRKAGAPANARAGGAETVDDLYTRGDENEARLIACAAKVDGLAKWDQQ